MLDTLKVYATSNQAAIVSPFVMAGASTSTSAIAVVQLNAEALAGPASESSLGTSSLDRYPTGVLHAVAPPMSGIDPASAGGGESEPVLLDEQEETASADIEADGQAFVRVGTASSSPRAIDTSWIRTFPCSEDP